MLTVSPLKDLLLAVDIIKVEDRAIVGELIDALAIEADPGLVNGYIQEQVKLEATIVYLVGKYTKLLEIRKRFIANYVAEQFSLLGSRDEDGLRWTKETRRYKLLSSDARYSVYTEKEAEAENFLSLLKDLSYLIFKRQDKLEQLSINYRREMSLDRPRD